MQEHSSFDDEDFADYFLPSFIESAPVDLVLPPGTSRRASPGSAMGQKALEEALKDSNISKAEARKLRNRLSALASRQRTQSHIDYLANMAETLQRELKNALIRLDKYENVHPSNKRRLDDLTSAPLAPAENMRKRAKLATQAPVSLRGAVSAIQIMQSVQLSGSSSTDTETDTDSSAVPLSTLELVDQNAFDTIDEGFDYSESGLCAEFYL